MTASRVCLDARGVLLPQGTGVATYAASLLACLPAAGWEPELLCAAPWGLTPGPLGTLPKDSLDRARRWTAALDPRARDAPAMAADDAVQTAGLPAAAVGRLRVVHDVFRTAQVHFDVYGRFLSVADRRRPPRIAHWSYPIPLRFRGVPNVYAVHDLIALLHPGLTPIRKERSERILRRLGQVASHVVTVSEAARRDIIGTLGWRPERVTNAYQAVTVTPRDVPDGDVRRAAAALGLRPGGYFLHAGQVERRKNIARLLAAYRASGAASPLVLLGPDGWKAEEELAAGGTDLLHVSAAAPGDAAGGPPPQVAPGTVLRVPWLPRDQAVALLRGARAVLLPSLAEGFGLPVAEAMALGTPAMASGLGALAEVAGDAALLVDPHDVRSIAEGLAALERDADLRARLAGSGLARARLFAPEAYSARLGTLYDRVLADPAPGIAARGEA